MPFLSGAAAERAYQQLVDRIWEGVQPEAIVRVSAHFTIKPHTLDAAIGRAAHIHFLDDVGFVRNLVMHLRARLLPPIR